MSADGDTMYRLAGALCIVAGSHHTDDWPCGTHIAEARRQLSAPASSPSADGPASIAAGLDGVSDDTKGGSA